MTLQEELQSGILTYHTTESRVIQSSPAIRVYATVFREAKPVANFEFDTVNGDPNGELTRQIIAGGGW
jgi:hypothetical protein